MRFWFRYYQSLSKKTLSADERRIIFTTLLDTRHRFVQELSEKTSSKRDFVREQFVTAWQQLSPIFRNHLGNEPSRGLLGYLAFFTAADALSGLDQLGPSFGFEISRNGLIRLAKLLDEQGTVIELLYQSDVDPALRDILGMGAPIIVAGPAFDAGFHWNGVAGNRRNDPSRSGKKRVHGTGCPVLFHKTLLGTREHSRGRNCRNPSMGAFVGQSRGAAGSHQEPCSRMLSTRR